MRSETFLRAEAFPTRKSRCKTAWWGTSLKQILVREGTFPNRNFLRRVFAGQHVCGAPHLRDQESKFRIVGTNICGGQYLRGPAFAGTNIQFFGDQFLHLRGPIFTFTGADFHIRWDRFPRLRGAISTFARTNILIFEDRYLHLRGPIVTSAGTNSRICGGQ